jgi:hypothetical protein
MRISAKSNSEAIRKLLSGHPMVDIPEGPSQAAIEFVQNGTKRSVWINRPDIELFGLVEIIDNNPPWLS